MMGIKCFSVIVLSIFLSTGLSTEVNANKKNSGKRPDWVQSSQPDYLVAKGIGIALETAKSDAENSLKSLVIDSAVNLLLSHNSYFKQINVDNEDARQLFINSAFYSGLENKTHTDFYWEKVKDKKNKSKAYHYYLQYYVDAVEMENAINEFALDHEALTIFESVKEELENSFEFQGFDEMKKKLMFLNAKLSDNNLRKAECEALLNEIEEKYNSIEISEILNIPGKLIVCQTLNNKLVFGSKPPKVKSKSVIIGSVEKYNEQWIITYKNISRNKDISDVISVEFDNSGIKKVRDFEIDTKEEKMEIKLTGAPIVIKRNKMIKIYLASLYRKDIVLDRVVIHYNDLNFTDTKLNQVLDGTGIYTIRYLTSPGFHKIKVGDSVNGELHYKSKLTGKKEIYRFYNQKLETVQ